MKIIKILAVLVISSFSFFAESPAQNNTGTNFWLAFNRIPWDKEDHVYVYICSESAAKGRVAVESMGFEKRFAARPGEMVTVELPRKVLIDTNEIVTSKGIHVESDKPVAVFGLNNQAFGSDGFMAMPEESLGKKYYAMCYPGDLPSHILILSTQNNTSIHIEPSAPMIEKYDLPLDIKLNRGQTFLLKSEKGQDLTGTYIYSSDPIVVYSGNLGCFIPDMKFCCANHLVEQLPPCKSWGKTFLTSPLALKSKGDIFKILAYEDETDVSIDGDKTASIDKGKTFETFLTSNKSFEITSTKPVLIAQFSTSNQYDPVGETDPFMVIVPPVEQYQSSYVIAIPGNGFDTSNFLNIMTRLEGSSLFKLDNKIIGEELMIDTVGFYPTIHLDPGSHSIKSVDGRKFGVTAYGYNKFDGYGYSAGSGFEEINCEIYERKRYSVGIALTYPFAYGGQIELGMDNYNIVLGYLFAPDVGKLDGTPPPDYLSSDNYQHTIFLSPSYIFPYTCEMNFFGGPYLAVGLRKWRNLADIIGMPPEIIGVQNGSFLEYYLGIQFGVKYFLSSHFYLGLAASINVQTTHRFSDEKINGIKPGGSLFLTFNYAF